MYQKRRWNDKRDVARTHHASDTGSAGQNAPKASRLLSLLREISYRWHIAVNSPGIERASEIEHARAYALQVRIAEEYSHGYLEGWQECYAACLHAVEQESSTNDDVWAAGGMVVTSTDPLKTN